MNNSITEGKEQIRGPDADGVVIKAPMPAVADLKSEIAEASQLKNDGQAQASRERSSIESRTDLRLAATNEAMRSDPAREVTPLDLDRDTARRWADLDAAEFGRIRSETRRENSLEAIAGHMRVSPEYTDELKKRSPALADSARALNVEREKIEQVHTLPTIERNAAALAFPRDSRDVPEAEQRELAKQDAKTLAAMPEGSERHLAATIVGENARKHPAYGEELRRTVPQVAREAEAAAGERDTIRAIERRNNELLPVPRDALSVQDVREHVRQDLEALSTIKGQDSRHMAAVTIADNASSQANYRAELQLQALEVFKEVQAAAAENLRREVDKDSRKSADFASMQQARVERAQGWTPEQAADQVRKDVASLGTADKTERFYLQGDMAVAMQHSKAYSETLTKEAPDVARDVEARRAQEAADRAAADMRRDNIGAAAQSRSALIDAAALAAVATIRTRETARVVERLASAPETSTQQLRDAQQSFKAPPLDGRVTAPNDPDIAAQRERAIKRPVSEDELSQALRTRFIITHEKTGLMSAGRSEFTFRDGDRQGQTAFVDAGKSLATQLEDKATIRAMIEVATAKKWKEVTVSGSDDFRRNAWLEARVKGLDVKGYEPREADKELLASLQPAKKEKPENRIMTSDREPAMPGQASAPKEADRAPAPEKRQKPVHIDSDKLTVSEKSVLDASRGLLVKEGHGPEASAQYLRELESRLRGERVYIGEVLSHGHARFKFDEKNDMSYQVTLKTPRGEQVVWGKDLAEAMKDRAPGESIVLRNIGKTEVTVTEKIRDEKGQQVGRRDKSAQRNEWTAEPLAKFSERARAELTEKQTRRPALAVYDGKAPRAPAQTPSQSLAAENQRNPSVQRPGRDR